MRELIDRKLVEIEDVYEVKLLFAVESGSRAWGFPSQDSDYDVRFVYMRKPNCYLSIDEKRDVIEVPINDMLDINGWDIRKALKLFRKSNPSLMEWLTSEMVYWDNFGFRDELLQLREQVFSPRASLHHYLSMAKGNFREYLQNDQVKVKKYFYVLRPILACLWIEKYHSNPPILFQTLLETMVPNSQLKSEVQELLRRKIAGDEMDAEKRIDVINEFILNKIEHIQLYAASCRSEVSDPTERLNDMFRNYLRVV